MIKKRTLFGFNLSLFIDGLVKLQIKEVRKVESEKLKVKHQYND